MHFGAILGWYMQETDFGAILCISIFHSQHQEGESKIHCYWRLIVQIVGFYRLVAICEDIYAARAAGELELEEGLFWTLIKIYRAPYILMEYTKVE
jgi:hypothetical protein